MPYGAGISASIDVRSSTILVQEIWGVLSNKMDVFSIFPELICSSDCHSSVFFFLFAGSWQLVGWLGVGCWVMGDG